MMYSWGGQTHVDAIVATFLASINAMTGNKGYLNFGGLFRNVNSSKFLIVPAILIMEIAQIFR